MNGEQMTKEEYRNERTGYDTIKKELRANSGVTRMKEWYDSMFVGELEGDFFSHEYWEAYYDVINQYYDGALSREEFEEEYRKGCHAFNVSAADDETLKDIADKTNADYERLTDKNRRAVLIINGVSLSTDNLLVSPKRHGNPVIMMLKM